jgi:hypothetical protein
VDEYASADSASANIPSFIIGTTEFFTMNLLEPTKATPARIRSSAQGRSKPSHHATTAPQKYKNIQSAF